jgi:hypothetical protein
MSYSIDVTQPPGRAQPHHLGDHLGGILDVEQQRAGVHEVERVGRQPGVPGIRGHDLHPIQAPLGGGIGRQVGDRRAGVQADDPAAGGNALSHQVDNAARAATEVDRAYSFSSVTPVTFPRDEARCAAAGQSG